MRELTDNPTPLQSDHLPDPVPAEDVCVGTHPFSTFMTEEGISMNRLLTTVAMMAFIGTTQATYLARGDDGKAQAPEPSISSG